MKVLQLPSCAVGGGDEVCRVLVSQQGQSVFMSPLLDVAVGGEVLGCWRALDQIGSGEGGECSCIVAGVKVGVGEVEGIRVRV